MGSGLRRAIRGTFPAVKLPFQRSSSRALRQPARSPFPAYPHLHVGAAYRGARVGGDFFDFAAAGDRKLLMLLLDIAGKREEALDIAACVQETFRAASLMFEADSMNEAVALSELVLDINRTILAASGSVRCAPGFIASYNETLGTLCYINAGHTPALVKDSTGITRLEACGLPLGLFSHATHDAQMCVLEPQAVLLLVSRGLAEVKAGRGEFGMERAVEYLTTADGADPQQLCAGLIEQVRLFIEESKRTRLLTRNSTVAEDDPFSKNDVTAVCCARVAKAAAIAR